MGITLAPIMEGILAKPSDASRLCFKPFIDGTRDGKQMKHMLNKARKVACYAHKVFNH